MTMKEAKTELGLKDNDKIFCDERLEEMRREFEWRVQFQHGEDNLARARRGIEAVDTLLSVSEDAA